jgi:hypothetical protein
MVDATKPLEGDFWPASENCAVHKKVLTLSGGWPKCHRVATHKIVAQDVTVRRSLESSPNKEQTT